jgi:hypothetical protein
VVGDDNTGRVDYTILKGAELICISEAKESDMTEGLAVGLDRVIVSHIPPI